MRFLVSFFIKNGIHSKKTLWMIILSLIPVVSALLLWLIKPILLKEGIHISDLFPKITFLFFLHFILPVISIFIGSAVLADEVDERTLPYLLVRPIPRWSITLSKLLSAIITGGAIILISLSLTYTIIIVDGGSKRWISDLPLFFQCFGVLMLGLMAYTPLFALLGGTLKRPVLTGLFFAFGWESWVAFIPTNIKFFTVVSYLHRLFPRLNQARETDVKTMILNIILPTKQTSILTSLLIIIAMSAIFTSLCLSLLYIKEYRLEQS